MIPIHTHTEYSKLDGLSSCDEVARRCVELGCSCCGITDHGTVAGHLEFGNTLAKYDLKPIYGCELYHGTKTKFVKSGERDQAHFVAGALTDEGLRNLWRLVDASSKNFRYVGRIDWSMLERFSEGLFGTSACIQGLVPKGLAEDDIEPLNRYLEIFSDRFFIELHTYPSDDQRELNKALVSVAQERGIPVVYANDAHFAFPGQYDDHDVYMAMQMGESVDTPIEDRKMWHPNALYIQSEEDIRKNLDYLPDQIVDEALRNTQLIGDMVNAKLPGVRRHLPTFIPKESPWTEKKWDNAALMFLDLVEEGIEARYGDRQDAWERAEQELEVFLSAGLEHYFLQAWDFCKFCDENGIARGPGRGSSAGAIVAYALGITDIDPLHYGLVFERFYNAGREKGFPDIDNDFPKEDRPRVRKYLESRWGEENVRSIGTVTRLKPKAALDKTYNAHGVTFKEKEEVKQIVIQTPDIEILDTESIGWSRESQPGKRIYVMEAVGEDIARWIAKQPSERQDRLWGWIEFVDTVCNRVSNYGVHASGIVVADTPLDAELPCFWSAGKELSATMFAMGDVDKRMFVKQDILGLRTLDTLQDWSRQMEKMGMPVNWSGLEFEDEKNPSEKMWSLLDRGLSLGIFQIEDGYARRLCKDFKPRCVEDLAIIVALNRPGPIRSGAPDSFKIRREGGEDEEFDGRKIPILEDILEPTYGWFLYQEQVIAFFNRLGYSLSESDAVRKILGKKRPEEMNNLYEGKGEWEGRGYMEVASELLGEDLGRTIWEKLEGFAAYSFNKSHAVAYATLAFRTLYAKYTAAPEFTMALIRTNPEDAGLYVGEARRMGIMVLPPNIQKSGSAVDLVEGDIYFGLSNVKGVGEATAEYIVNLRERYSLDSPESLREVLTLETGEWEKRRDVAKKMGTAFTERSPRQLCRSNTIDALERAGAFDAQHERVIDLPDRQKLEQEYLGVILSDDAPERLASHWEELETCDTYEDLEVEGTHTLPGVISAVREVHTKKTNKRMGIVSIEYEMDNAEFVVFPREWSNYTFLFKMRTPGIFTVTKDEKGIHFENGVKLT
jgi:DNA polymerase-3 subunit alpha